MTTLAEINDTLVEQGQETQDVFQHIAQTTTDTNDLLDSFLRGQTAQRLKDLEAQIETKDDEDRSVFAPGPGGQVGLDDDTIDRLSEGFGGFSRLSLMGIVGGLGGVAGAGMLGAIVGGALKFLKKGALLALAPLAGDVVEMMLKDTLISLGNDEQFASEVANRAGDATTAGLLTSVFLGKKAGIGAAIGNWIGTGITSRMEDETLKKEFMGGLGMGITNEMAIEWGGAIVGGLSLMLTPAILKTVFAGKAALLAKSVGVALLGNILKFALRMTPVALGLSFGLGIKALGDGSVDGEWQAENPPPPPGASEAEVIDWNKRRMEAMDTNPRAQAATAQEEIDRWQKDIARSMVPQFDDMSYAEQANRMEATPGSHTTYGGMREAGMIDEETAAILQGRSFPRQQAWLDRSPELERRPQPNPTGIAVEEMTADQRRGDTTIVSQDNRVTYNTTQTGGGAQMSAPLAPSMDLLDGQPMRMALTLGLPF